MQSRKRQSLVAEFVAEQLQKSTRTIDEVAEQAGMPPKVISMISAGQSKLPINQVDALAKALGVETVYLLRLVLEDYLPDSWSIVQDKLQELAITPYEQEVIDGYRRLSQGRDIGVLMFPAHGYVEVVPPTKE